MTMGSRVWIRSRRRWGIDSSRWTSIGQAQVGERQRVAAAEHDLLDRRVRGQI